MVFGVFNTRKTDSYPTQLGNLLGSKYAVCNYGCSGTSLSRQGKFPYYGDYGYNAAINGLPNIVILMLGTNDTQDESWINQDFFEGETTWLISQFLNISSNPAIYICSPPPMYSVKYNGKYNNIIYTNIIPAIKNVVKQQQDKGNKVQYIDVNSVFPNPSVDPDYQKFLTEFMADAIHPNKNGNTMIAVKVYETLIKQL